MKLYATVTSERASKGQGGNRYLEINITQEDGKTIGYVVVNSWFGIEKLDHYVIRWFPNGADKFKESIILKEGNTVDGEIQCLRNTIKAKKKKD